MKKLAIGLLLVLAGIGAIGLATVQTTIQTAFAGTSVTGVVGTHEFVGSTSSASSKGPSSTSSGVNPKCHDLAAIGGGTCSESRP